MSVTSMKTNDDKRVELEIKVDAETFEKAVDAGLQAQQQADECSRFPPRQSAPKND